MDLVKFINDLKKVNQVKLSIQLLELALPIWNEYNQSNEIKYTDSVVGAYHKVDKTLLDRSINILKKYNECTNLLDRRILLNKVKQHYNEILEPCIALTDNDFEIPTEIELLLYSVYNLMKYTIGGKFNVLNENLAYISINQSIDSMIKVDLLNIEELLEVIELSSFE